jgi:hypothetical protein
VGDLSAQVHDFEPGIADSGLFWTIPIPFWAIDISPWSGRARFRVRHLAVPDFHDFITAVSPDPPTKPSHVSFDMTWKANGDRQTISDPDFGYRGTFIPSDLSIVFSASNDGSGVVYTSDSGPQTTIGGGVGRERNGVFF